MVESTQNPRRRVCERVYPVHVSLIHPTPENEKLYRPVDPTDPDVVALAESIRQQGVREPLLVTQDHYILSGHRRFTAAKLAGLAEVPCRIEPIDYCNTDEGQILQLLREHNRQRVKSVDELLREEVVSADPSVAYDWLMEFRRGRSDMSDCEFNTIQMTQRRGRKTISHQKWAMVEAITAALQQRRSFWPLSDRQIHYIMLNDPPLRNTLRPNSRYANDRASYGDLCDLLTRLRLVGMVPWSAIADETRPTQRWRCFGNAQDFIRQELDGLFGDYARDLQRSQPNHVEVLAEKLTLKNVIQPITAKYCIPTTIGRGYCSITPRYEMATRFRRSGKDQLIVLLLSDFDPDGEAIAESFARSMRDDFGIEELVPIKVALTSEQVQTLDLKPEMQAKRSSVHYRKFKKRFGDDVYELEAVDPEELQRILRDAIEGVLDMTMWDREVEEERKDAASLQEARQRACIALAGIKGTEPSN